VIPPTVAVPTLADRVDAALPQTQCTRCGYPDCRSYAQAIAEGSADINRCPPGGAEGIARLAALTGRAPLALDLRREVRDQMRQGKDDQQVVAYLTERYGDFVLYRPPFKPETWLLWLGPPAFLLVGGAIWLIALRRRQRSAQAEEVDEAAIQRAEQLLLGKASDAERGKL
jgi:cytochrome c-type biogenesis protein CcmH/NrfF